MYCKDDKYRLLIYALLDQKELLEHGTAIRSPWGTTLLKLIFPLIQAAHDEKLTQTLVDAECTKIEQHRLKFQQYDHHITRMENDASELLLELIGRQEEEKETNEGEENKGECKENE
jgi:hypothetical protein